MGSQWACEADPLVHRSIHLILHGFDPWPQRFELALLKQFDARTSSDNDVTALHMGRANMTYRVCLNLNGEEMLCQTSHAQWFVFADGDAGRLGVDILTQLLNEEAKPLVRSIYTRYGGCFTVQDEEGKSWDELEREAVPLVLWQRMGISVKGRNESWLLRAECKKSFSMLQQFATSGVSLPVAIAIVTAFPSLTLMGVLEWD